MGCFENTLFTHLLSFHKYLGFEEILLVVHYVGLFYVYLTLDKKDEDKNCWIFTSIFLVKFILQKFKPKLHPLVQNMDGKQAQL